MTIFSLTHYLFGALRLVCKRAKALPEASSFACAIPQLAADGATHFVYFYIMSFTFNTFRLLLVEFVLLLDHFVYF